ncbi:hypothetical protein FT643_09120 [Ketobacter sp. MCCC 1A13808]|uniref:hypothetical protein n=1 Tax=Ketobacter sp. MCCC 1A13808 TaxID=2602738 RepID=UPI000F1CB1A4|nr:hypothetical protein [Ketobacter sp. MCCC 1A13808]MVF12306.1 hypothetical protein [Ketobacter sp. MCCC 1A13808]RLP52472.1 MAG: hypothetical protein D6160_20730 [Ketobacter sp.]
MDPKLDLQDSSSKETFFAHIFSAAFLQLDQIRHEHNSVLTSDRMMNQKLEYIAGVLKQLSASDEAVPGSLAELIAVQISKTSRYAKDMAEEEQRIVAESHNEADGNEEEEAAEYFEMSDQLDYCAKTLRRNLYHLAHM